jgi:hypothetical protein
MLYLAQVQKKTLGKVGLRLLACQKSEHTWTIVKEAETVPTSEATNLGEGLLVLAEITSDRHVATIQDAKDWVVDLTETFLTTGVTPTFLRQETERAEQWRQSLTLQSQELDRRALELEARREQVQELEEKLKREKKLLEAMAQQSPPQPDVDP